MNSVEVKHETHAPISGAASSEFIRVLPHSVSSYLAIMIIFMFILQ